MACAYPMEVQGKMVPCGKCQGCRRRHRRQWVARMRLEARDHPETSFVTLTYGIDPRTGKGEEPPLVHNKELDEWFWTLQRPHLRSFIRSIGRQAKSYGLRFRHFACGEYGEKTGRPHFHLIAFGLGAGWQPRFEETWKKGFVSAYPATPATMAYVAKYCLKGSSDPEATRLLDLSNDGPEITRASTEPFRTTSRLPAIGHPYVESIVTSLKTTAARRDLGDVLLQKKIRIDGERYPVDRVMRDKVLSSLDFPMTFEEQAYEPTAKEVAESRAQEQIALTRRHHKARL